MMDEFVGSFIEEAKELLLLLEDDLIGLEKNPGNAEILNNIFRVMHTLKGSAGMVGFKNIQDLSHEFESLYEQIRDGNLAVNTGIIDITLKGKDLILSALNSVDGKKDANLLSLVKDKLEEVKKDSPGQSAAGQPAEFRVPDNLYVILFYPDKNIFERGLDPDKTIDEIKSSEGTCILLHEKKMPWEKQKSEKICQTTWEIYVNTAMAFPDLNDIFLFYDEDEYKIFKLPQGRIQLEPDLAERLGKLYKNKIKPEQHIKDCLGLMPELSPEIELPQAAKKSEAIVESLTEESLKADTDTTINVSSHKLDELMNLVSELVTLTATIEAHASGFNDPRLNNSIENIEKLTKKFRNNALDLRLIPVGTLLNKFKRQIRDLAKNLGKKVNLLIEGQDIEIDKTILKSIESPLQHIIRNCLDHGIEPEEVRRSKGKTPEGLLKITAFYSGASVIIQVQDDGAGINLDRVRECAIKKGLIQPDQIVTKEELIGFIMEPGFSTSENISMVSGRGVGMDVVRKELSLVGGSLEVFTEKDLGTSITMKLPTTLTIIDTLMVEVGETQTLIPVIDIEYCFKDYTDNLFRKDNKYVRYKNNPIPLVSLREQFRYPASGEKEQMIIVINKFERKYAITADKIIGEHQAVIKPLGDLFVNQPFFSGGSIMADGKMALILDTNFLYNHATKLN